MRADEVSDDCNRCCCSPYHPLRLEFRHYIPVPGDGSTGSYNHLSEDLQRDFAGISGDATRMQVRLRELYKNQPVLFSVVRNDGQRCCKFPMKCLSTFVCCACCMDGVRIYGGTYNLYIYIYIYICLCVCVCVCVCVIILNGLMKLW